MDRVRAVVSSEIILPNLPIRSIERLRFALSYPHPEYVKMRRLGKKGEGVPTRYGCMIEAPDGTIRAPRGAVDVVRAMLAEDGLRPEFEDWRSRGDAIGPLPAVPSRDYQRTGVVRLETKTQGVIVLPCGGGKTRLGVSAIARLGRTTIVLAHTGDLLDQWREEIRSAFGIEAGVVDDQHKEIDRPIVVASIFSLLPMLQADPAIGARFGFVLVDECHHAPAVTIQSILRLLPARYRLGLTATYDREDGHTQLVGWSFGPKLLVKMAQELIRDGFLMRPEIVEIPTDFEFEMPDVGDPRRLVKLDRALVSDAARNDLIVSIVAREVRAGESVLVLSNRKGHCRLLGKMLAHAGVPPQIVLGSTPKKKRKAAIEAMRTGEESLVIATSLADEGLNIQRLSRIVLAFPERARGRTTQRVGRLMRVWGKVPILYDVVDEKVDTLARRAGERRRAYRSLGLIP